MFKKFSLLAAAMAILAFAVPALASASTGLTKEGATGTLVPVGTLITGTSTNSVVTSSKLGELKCEKVTLNGEVTVDSATAGVEGIGVGEGSGSNCKRNGTISIEVKNIKLTSLKSPKLEKEEGTEGKGTATFTFTAVLPELTCNYSATNASGTYVRNTNKLKFTNAALTVTPSACGTSTLSGEFGLETTASPNTPILIM